ncbi:hypothetical protein [Smaragdicoccus niigatensis]|uniref:Rv0361 family membrane protein n=1 Tax=Smaragdicoccus niigatensis TaxID=359359 RepID=UPI0003724BA8|nr:hypothetical protein [Smaragdicoccus niigatensis]
MSDTNDQVTSRTAMPQRVGPEATPPKQRKPRGKIFKRLVKIVLLLLILAALAVGGLFAYDKTRGPTDDDKVDTAITNYMTAVKRGDLAGLRATTCGQAYEYYVSLNETQFAAIYNASRDSVPIIDSVKRVEVTDDRALAEVSAHTNAHAQQTVRTVALQRAGDKWKVCDAGVGAGTK